MAKGNSNQPDGEDLADTTKVASAMGAISIAPISAGEAASAIPTELASGNRNFTGSSGHMAVMAEFRGSRPLAVLLSSDGKPYADMDAAPL